VRDVKPVADVQNIQNIAQTKSCAGPNFDIAVSSLDHSQQDFVIAHAHFPTTDIVKQELSNFRSNCPGTISAELLVVAAGYFESAFLTNSIPNVYGLVYSLKQNLFEIDIKCNLQAPYVCEIMVTKHISGT